MKSTIYLSNGDSITVTEDQTTLMNSFNGAKMVMVTQMQDNSKLVVNSDNVVKIEVYTE